MHIALAALFLFGILTLWVPGVWPVTVFEVGIFVLAGVVVLRALRRPIPFAYPLAPLSGAVIWGVLQWLTGQTAYVFATKTAIIKWATLLCVLATGLVAFKDSAVRRWFRAAMLWFAVIVAVTATIQTYTSPGCVFWIFSTPYTSNFMPPFPYHNHYAAFIEAVLPIALYEALKRDRRALLYAVAAAALYASVIVSASRSGALLATAEVLVVTTVMWLRRRMSHRDVGLAVFAVVFSCVTSVVVAGPGPLWARLREPDPLRPQFARSSIDMIRERPWFGVGMGTWPIVYPRYARADFGRFVNQAHSDWLEWTAEGGIPFAVLIASLFCWTARQTTQCVWGSGAVAVFLQAIVDYPFSRPVLGAWPILIVALLAAERLEAGGIPNPKSRNC